MINPKTSRTRALLTACTSIGLFVTATVAFAQQALPAAVADSHPTSAVPEAPAPPTNPQTAAPPSLAQQIQQAQQPSFAPQQPFQVSLPHSRNPLSPYRPSDAPPLDLSNSPRLQSLIRDGKLYISLSDTIALAIENNLDLAYFRYNFPIAQTDYARTKAGGSAHGVNTGIVQSSTQGGFSGGSSGGAGASSGSAAAGAGGIVTSTLGSGTAVASFDPYVTFQGYVDHTVFQETNPFLVGVPIFKQNTIEALASYTQSFPMGTGLNVNYVGQRLANNSPYEAVNPTLYSNFQVELTQHLLAGFGFATNERYMSIAKKNMNINDLAFRAQVIATITQVENIYWDLVNAYEDEQIKERLVAFAHKTLQDDQKQLELNAIPAMQVIKDESDVATSEGDLTISRSNLRLNELLIINALTKSDDPGIDEVSVVPLDRVGPPDPNT